MPTGVIVVIKAIETSEYKRLSLTNGISEGRAMVMCENSSKVINLFEKFVMEDTTYIVTKFMKGGDLVSYLEQRGVDKLPEN